MKLQEMDVGRLIRETIVNEKNSREARRENLY